MPQRYVVVVITAIAAMLMYIDRVCFSILADPVQTDLGLTEDQKGYVLGAFFLTYALCQIPMGALADRFGARLVLSLSIAVWSGVTALTGFVSGFATLIVVRLLLGIAESGAYPAAAGLVKRWARPAERGRFSSVVALGGRIGGAVAPWLTGKMAIVLAGVGSTVWLTSNPSHVNWRAAFVVYGLVGLIVAVLFWAGVRDHPPRPTSTKRPDDEAGPAPALSSTTESSPASAPLPIPLTFAQRLAVIVSRPNMWLFGILQFCNNVSWAFLVTLLPTFLKEANVSLDERKDIQTGVLLAGCVGMIVGGVATDVIHRRLGPRWGRSIPIAAMMTMCSLMCGVVSTSPGLWIAVGALAVMALCQDLGIPSVWAYAQDVGGRNVGTVLGWGNMLGNLGAALSPVLLTEVRQQGGWGAAFALCSGVYAVSVVCGLLLDASKPVDKADL